MRVIRTEMYFDVQAIEPWDGVNSGANPGIAVAYFKNPSQIPVIVEDIPDNRDMTRMNPESHAIYDFLDLMLSNPLASRIDARAGSHVGNQAIVQYILQQPIVIEQSPPEWLNFQNLLKGASGAGIGTYIGLQAAGSNPLLLYVTVPMGIIVISSTLGVSRALEKGLNLAIGRLFGGK